MQIENILEEIDKSEKTMLMLLKEIATIPSPTGHEEKKIKFLKRKIEEYGFKDISIDNIGNCIVEIPTKSKNKKKKTILVVAHTDTACDPGEKNVIKENEKYLYGHGTCDNSAGVTGILTTLNLIQKYNLTFPYNLIFGLTVGEEGLGSKRGMKQIIQKYGHTINAVLNVESHHIGRITNQAIGQYRCKILVDTKMGGHSFRDFGRPNANIILAQIISDFSKKKLPQTKGKTSFNIGQMEGKGSINAISKISSCLFEIRSENNKYLEDAKEVFDKILAKYKKKYPAIDIAVEIYAQNPAIIFPPDHIIYKLIMDVHKKLSITSKINAGNTDGDVSLAIGIPTATIGTSEGWNTHSLDEYMEKKSLTLGIKQVFMVIYKISSSF